MSHQGELKEEYDVEKDEKSVSADAAEDFSYSHPIFRKLLSWGIETQGAHEKSLSRDH